MRRRQVPLVEFSGMEPPEELLWFYNGGGPWTAEGFAAFLRARIAWRDTHAAPLPALPPRERVRLRVGDLPAALVAAEETAPKALPEWAKRAEAREFSGRGGTGRLAVGRPAPEGSVGHPGGGGAA